MSITNNKGGVDFFHSDEWGDILTKSFGSTMLKLSNEGKQYKIHSFPYMGFKVAIPDFPIPVDDFELNDYMHSESLRSLMKSTGINFLRVTGPERSDINAPIIQTLPKTVICNLDEWHIKNLSSSVRRNIRKFERSEFVITEEISDNYSTNAYNLYLGTISRHEGKAKYNAEYFKMLLLAANQNIGVHIIFALNKEDQVTGYMVTADHKNTTYYLHGGIDFSYQNQRPMDALFYQAITASINRGMANFDMLTSPKDQPNLVRYKEKWGGETSFVSTYTLALNPLLNRSLKIVRKLIL